MPRKSSKKKTPAPTPRRRTYPRRKGLPPLPPPGCRHLVTLTEGAPVQYPDSSFALDTLGHLIIYDHRPPAAAESLPIWAVYARGGWLSVTKVEEYRERVREPGDDADLASAVASGLPL